MRVPSQQPLRLGTPWSVPTSCVLCDPLADDGDQCQKIGSALVPVLSLPVLTDTAVPVVICRQPPGAVVRLEKYVVQGVQQIESFGDVDRAALDPTHGLGQQPTCVLLHVARVLVLVCVADGHLPDSGTAAMPTALHLRVVELDPSPVDLLLDTSARRADQRHAQWAYRSGLHSQPSQMWTGGRIQVGAVPRVTARTRHPYISRPNCSSCMRAQSTSSSIQSCASRRSAIRCLSSRDSSLR